MSTHQQLTPGSTAHVPLCSPSTPKIPLPSFMVIPTHRSAFEGERAGGTRRLKSQPAPPQGHAPRLPVHGKNRAAREVSQDECRRTKPSINVRFDIFISHIFPVHCLEHMNQINHFQRVPGHRLAEVFLTGSDQNTTCTYFLLITFLPRLRLLKQP